MACFGGTYRRWGGDRGVMHRGLRGPNGYHRYHLHEQLRGHVGVQGFFVNFFRSVVLALKRRPTRVAQPSALSLFTSNTPSDSLFFAGSNIFWGASLEYVCVDLYEGYVYADEIISFPIAGHTATQVETDICVSYGADVFWHGTAGSWWQVYIES